LANYPSQFGPINSADEASFYIMADHRELHFTLPKFTKSISILDLIRLN
jgi:hypothetical protein